MAMLAEPRRKQRIGPNPRGKFFTEDDDNRGRQMLVKMGWKTGDGLGVTNQGMSEPLKPKIHTDARGLGYDRKTDPWVAHNEEFEQLLKNLNTSNGADESCSKRTSGDEDSSNEGLEKKSKGSRSRIHYHKFVKNKDLSRASTKDMSCIFGKALDETAAIFSALNSEVSDSMELQTTESGDCELKNSVESEQVASDTEEKPRKKKKKKRNKEKELEEAVMSEPLNDGDKQPVPEEMETVSSEALEIKKKKKRNKEKDFEQAVTSEPLNDSDEQNNGIQSEQPAPEEMEIIPSETLEVKKKKKKRKHKDLEPGVEETENIGTEEQQTNVTTQVDDNTSEEVEPVEKDSKKKKKKSKKRKRSCEEEEEKIAPSSTNNNDHTDQPELCTPDEEVISIKKKKKKKKDRANSVEEQTEESERVKEPEDVSNNAVGSSTTGEADKVEKFGSLQFINRGSIVDYFRSKMQSRGLLSSSVKM